MKLNIREILKTFIEYIFRRKSLNYILYILAAFWIGQAASLSNSEGIETLLQAIKGNAEFPHLRYLIASIGGILFTEGSWLIFTLTSAMIFFFGFLKYKEISKSDSISPTELLDQIKDIQKDDKKFLTALPPKTTGFIGREEELKELDDRLKAKDQVLLVNGLGGIGKTEVCRNYFWANTNKFEKLGWIDYLGNLKESFTNQFQIQEISVTENESIDERFAKILHYLANLDPNSLLVIDNIEDLEDADLPKLRALPCKVIASSRLTLKGFEVYPLGFLSMEKCKTLFLQNYRGKPDNSALETIIELAGQHTLAVELLAKTAKNSDLEIAELLNKLEEVGFNLNEAIPESVETTWHNETQKKQFFKHMESVFELVNISEDEKYILTNLSVLPAIFIERKEITDWLKLQSKDSLNSLVEKGWLQQQDSQVFMHQIIQEVARPKFKPTAKICERLVKSLTGNLTVEPGKNPLSKAGYVIFAEAVLANLIEVDQDLATLSNNVASIYQDLGQLHKALEFQLKNVEIEEAIHEQGHPSLATSYNNLAGIYQDLGQLQKALKFHSKSLKIREEILEPNQPSLAVSYNNMAQIYQDLGQLPKAIDFQMKSVKIMEEVREPNRQHLVTAYNNLATIYRDFGQLQKALELKMKSLNIEKEIFEPKHPILARSYNNLAGIYQDLGQLQKALEFHSKSLKIRKDILEPMHPDLAQSYNNMATCYHHLGQLQKALDFQLKSVKTREEIFPQNHPNLANSYNNLAQIYRDLGQLEKALEFQMKSLKIREEILDPKHPDLANSYNNLATIYFDKKDYQNAHNYCKPPVAIYQIIFPDGHPKLGNVLRWQAEIEKHL